MRLWKVRRQKAAVLQEIIHCQSLLDPHRYHRRLNKLRIGTTDFDAAAFRRGFKVAAMPDFEATWAIIMAVKFEEFAGCRHRPQSSSRLSWNSYGYRG